MPGFDRVADIYLQRWHAGVDAAAQLPVGEQAELSFDLVEPGRIGRGEVQMELGVTGEPSGDHRRPVSGVVVADQVDVEACHT